MKLHFRANNWINDPNGFIYYHDNYHLFYQYFPYDTKWGTMHWGHKISKDLIHWEDKGIALYPSKEFDRNGCFSGSAIEVNDKMYIYYTAIVYNNLNPDNIHVTGDKILASQAMITSDGITFNPDNKKVIIPMFKEGDIGDASNTRDPKVFKEDNAYYMVLGSQYGEHKKHGEILIYSSNNALEWEYRNRLIDQRIDSNMWECPDLFKIDNQYILIMSPENILNDGINYPSHATWSLVDFNKDTCSLKITQLPQYLDYGLDLYAPQTTLDKDGNRMVISWLRMPIPGKGNDWIGLYTFPRVITLKNNHLYFKIHPNIEKLFTKKTNTFSLEPIKISYTLKENSYLNIGGYKILYKNNILTTDRSLVFCDTGKLFNKKTNIGKVFKSPILEDNSYVDIYVDEQVIEIYINDGQYVMSNIVYNLENELEYSNIDNLIMKEMEE